MTDNSIALDRPVHVGIDQWQSTPAQLSADEIDCKVKAYANALANVHTAQVRLFRALLWTDETEADFACIDLIDAIKGLPAMPDWPNTDDELIARLRGKFPVIPKMPKVTND